MSTEEISKLSATEMANLIRSKKLSPTEAITASLDMIEKRNPKLNALTHVDSEGALKRAKYIEARLARGEDPGVLAGVPTAIKDLFGEYPGWPSTLGGIPRLKNVPVTRKSYFPTKWEANGGVVLGMSNASLFGYNGACDNPLYGTTSTPFDPTRNSGGSSGGGASATASGMLPIGGGNDGGGSIRIPSSWCGCFGFHPSGGRVPLSAPPNIFDAYFPFVYDGVCATSVEDSALGYSVLADFDPGNPFAQDPSLNWSGYLKQKSMKGVRIGYDFHFGGVPVEPEVLAKLTQALAVWEGMGAIVVPITVALPKPLEQLMWNWRRLVALRMTGTLNELKKAGIDVLADDSHDLPPPVVNDLEMVKGTSFQDVHNALVERSQLYDAITGTFNGVDLIMTAVTSCLPVKNVGRGKTFGPTNVAGQAVDSAFGWICTFVTNLTGHPAASVPVGLVDGLPVNMQLIGPPHGDLKILAAAAAFEEAQPWRAAYRARIDEVLGGY
jgi:amidase